MIMMFYSMYIHIQLQTILGCQYLVTVTVTTTAIAYGMFPVNAVP
jgi:hypothetical protein